jgi:hypothetical protein
MIPCLCALDIVFEVVNLDGDGQFILVNAIVKEPALVGKEALESHLLQVSLLDDVNLTQIAGVTRVNVA